MHRSRTVTSLVISMTKLPVTGNPLSFVLLMKQSGSAKRKITALFRQADGVVGLVDVDIKVHHILMTAGVKITMVKVVIVDV